MTASAIYHIHLLAHDGDVRCMELEGAVLAEITELGLHRALVVNVNREPAGEEEPSVGVYFGGKDALGDPTLASEAQGLLDSGTTVIPVVSSLADFSHEVAAELHDLNGVEWSGEDPAVRVARILLEELGIEDRQRRVFISHKREDGLGAAEQLHDVLSHHGFQPFIDRFAIRPGERVQDYIADALEDHAFLLVLETELAHRSAWVYDEVDYALSHAMGILIVQWPGDPPPVPGSPRLPRIALAPDDLKKDEHGYDVLMPPARDRLLAEVEAAHAYGIVRRRRSLTRSVEEASLAGGAYACTPQRGWRLLVEHASGETLVGVAPRLPTAADLQQLDQARSGHEDGVEAMLVHSARVLREPLREHLSWVTGDRSLTLRAENAVGGVWT